MAVGTLRLRALIDAYLVAVVAGLLAVALVAGVVTYTTHAQEQTRTETRTASSWESTGEFTHRATVTNDTGPFAEGTVLRNQSVYLRQVAPRLNGSFTYTYTATESGNLTVDGSIVLVVQSVAEGAGDEAPTVYWRVERPVNEASASLAPGERVTVPFSLNTTAVDRTVAETDATLGNPPGETDVRLVARVSLSGTRNGEDVTATRTYQLPVSVEPSVYRVDDPGTVTNSGRQTERVRVPVEHGRLRTLGAPLALAVSLVLAIGLVAGRYTGRLTVTETEREWLRYRSHREEFDEWITAARLSPDVLTDRRVEVDSLEGLVDVAIDTDERVIDDRDRDRFVVLDDGVTYTYTPPSRTGDLLGETSSTTRTGSLVEEPDTRDETETADTVDDEASTDTADDATADDLDADTPDRQ